ncbi:MAG TPA: c-type cytochrome domain-containing protein [Flavisolibacter sp.]
MKKISIVALVGMGIFAFILSCKHEPLETTPPGNNPGTGSGGNGTGPNITCSPDTAYFQQQVLPIFISNCALSGCHDANTRMDGVQLTDYNSIITTGDVRPFNPNSSEIWEKINENDPSKRMPPPPRNPLSQAQKDIIRNWIMQGAKNNSCVASACDTTTVTFNSTIKTIINNKCVGCHSGNPPQGGINLTTHAGVKAKVSDGRLWGAINHFPGFSPMPKGGTKLSDCEIRQFKKWIDAGSPNN